MKQIKVLIVPAMVVVTLFVTATVAVGDKPTRNPNDTVGSPSRGGKTPCNLFPCHGLELSCKVAALKPCTEIYMMGDFCRQFARCEVVKGSCQLAKNPKLDQCKKCMASCRKDRNCDAKCRKKMGVP